MALRNGCKKLGISSKFFRQRAPNGIRQGVKLCQRGRGGDTDSDHAQCDLAVPLHFHATEIFY